MSNYHQILIVGNLVRDMEVRYSKEGLAIAKSALALTSGFGERKKTLFLNFTLWGKQAEAAGNMKKGDPILVQGQLQENAWKDKDGVEKKSVEVNAQSFQFMGARKDAGPSRKPNPSNKPDVPDAGAEVVPDYGDIPF